MQAIKNISRRTFLKATAFVAGGLVIAFAIPQAKRFMSKSPAAGEQAFAHWQ
jgi:isoquinoline 1-oxidoreductase subunit beta